MVYKYIELKKFFYLIAFSIFMMGESMYVDAQCVAPPACAGTSVSGGGGQTIPSGTTYYIAAGNTLSGNVTFTDATSILCIQGTWTGVATGAGPTGGTINVQSGGIINSGAWSYTGGQLIINNFVGGTITISSVSITGGVFTFTNCGDMTISGNFSNTGGTVTINNYASINVNGTLSSTNSGFTLHNYTGSQMYVGNNFTATDGTFINDAKICVTSTTTFTSGTFTNNDCFRTTSYSITGNGAFTNNSYMTVVGNFSNTGTNNSNNGTLVITGSYSNTGGVTYFGPGSLTTMASWSSTGNSSGPASGCAQIRVANNSTNTGDFVAANSGNIYFDDAGHPGSGFDSNTGNLNSIHVNNNTCTPTSYPACAMAGAACTSVLPITLTEFKAECKNGKMDIVWSTASETNNDFFTIERSKDGNTYDPIGVVDSKAPGGNSNQTLIYSFTDSSFPKEESGNNNVFYYRLKQTDFDGKYTYSYISTATCSDYCIGDVTIVSDNNTVFLNISSICSTNVTFSIYNALGQIVSTKTVFIETGYNTIELNANNIAQGIYFLKATTSNQSFQKKFGKQQ